MSLSNDVLLLMIAVDTFEGVCFVHVILILAEGAA